MESRRRTTSLLVVVLGLGSALLSGDALPQGYQTRFPRSQRCQTCPRDCSQKLSGSGMAEIVIDYPSEKPAKPKYQAQSPPGGPHPTPAPYVITVLQPQTQYSVPPPQPQPQYPASQPQPQPQYSAPPPQAQYSASPLQPQPQYSAYQPQPQPQYPVPPPQPQYPAPRPQPQYAVPPPPQMQYPVPPPPAQPYQPMQKRPVYPPPSNYLPEINPPCDCPDCQPDFDPYEFPGYDYEDAGYRYGRSLDSDDGYPMFSKYNRRSVDDDSKNFSPKKEFSQEPLPFADESGPPADFYKNYRPYKGESTDRREDDFEERSSRRDADNNERERLFVVYRADADDDKPSDSELESVIRQAMDVARQQKNQEDFAKARKPKSINRYRYEHEKYQDEAASEPVNFEPLKEDKTEAANSETRFNLSPGPLMNDESFVAEDGDDTLNPGTDQSKWTVVPSLSELEFTKPRMEDIEEIEAAVSVVPEMVRARNIMKVPKVVPKGVDIGDVREKVKKETIETVRAEEVEKRTELMEDTMQTPSIVTEAAKLEGPVESTATWSPTTNVSVS